MASSYLYLAIGLLLAAAASHTDAELEIPASKTEPDGRGGFIVTFQKGQNKGPNVQLVLNERLVRKASFSPANHAFDWPMPSPTAAKVTGIEVTVHASTKKVSLHLAEPLGREHLTWRVWVAGTNGNTVIVNKLYAEEPKQ